MVKENIVELCINWHKIAANAGVSFFTALTAYSFAGGSIELSLYSALVVAVITGGLAFFKEYQIQAEPEKPSKTLANLVLF